VQHGFVSIEHTRCADPAWHFRLGLPPSVKIAPGGAEAPTLETPRTLALFHRDEPPADIEVLGLVPPREVDAADWLDLFLEHEGKTVVSKRPVSMRAGVVGDVVATWKVDDQAFAGRFFATKWGPRLFVLCFRTPLDRYEELADDFFVTIATFAALDDSLGLFAEKVLTIQDKAPIPFRLVIPESWIVVPDPPGPEVSSFQATQIPPAPGPDLHVLHGKLSFAVAARHLAKSPRAAANAYLDAVRELGVVIEHDKFLEEKAEPPFERSWLLVSGVKKGEHPGEVRCRVMLTDKVWVIAGVLGPTRAVGALSWMANKRALDVVTSTLKLKP